VKWIALVAVVACALVGSLYATASPGKNPLAEKVSKLQDRLVLAELRISQ